MLIEVTINPPATRTTQTSIPTEKHNNSWIG